MKIRNAYAETPRSESGNVLAVWFNVEQEPGVCVAGEDGVFDVMTSAEAERMAEILAATSGPEYPLTVVRHERRDLSRFSVKSNVERRAL